MHRIDDVLTQARERKAFSGAAWSYGTADGPLARGLVGTTAWDGSPIGNDSRWDLASVTKPIVAIAIMSLIESGHLTLDDTIADHLPDYAGTDKADLTVRQLLTHTSGMPGQVPLFRWNATRDEMLAAIRGLPLLGPPDTVVVYSSQGFMVLGFIAEAVSGMTLDEIVAERITGPVGMVDTAFGVAAEQLGNAVATEDDPWRGGVVRGQVHDENAVVLEKPAGHAGLFSSLADMEALGQALCAEGLGRQGRMLSPTVHRVMVAPRTDHLNLRRSLGWQGHEPTGSPAGDLLGARGYGHTGFTGTSLWVDPDTRRYVVLLTNRVHPSRTSDAISRVRRLVHNIAFAPD